MPSRPLPSLQFDLGRLDPADRFERWRSMVGICEVEPAGPKPSAEFTARGSVWHLGMLVALDLRMGAQTHHRTRRHTRADQLDHYRLALMRRGRQSCDLDGRRVVMTPGDMLLVDQARPECNRFESDDGGNAALYIPREMLDEALPRPMDLHGAVPHGAAAGLLADHLRAVVQYAPRMTAGEASAMTAATVSLVAASVAACARNIEQARPAIESTLLRQACRHVDLHLCEDGLSAQSIAAFFKISRTTLYRLFEPMGGVACYIKERRLLRIHAILSESGPPRRIQRVAEDHGFTTFSHFSREFRRLFGYPPSETRCRGEAAVLPPASASGAGRERPFDAWLRSLRG